MGKLLKRTISFIKENKLFSFAIFLTAIFIISPILLKIQVVDNALSGFMYSLKEQGYKSSYVETLGAILGTFLAITGAVWTQRQIDKNAEEEKKKSLAKENRFRMVIIYYDLKLCFQDLKKLYESMLVAGFIKNKEMTDEFWKMCRAYIIYIDNEWIRNVSALVDVFEEDFIEQLFLLYGEIDTVGKILAKNETNQYEKLKVVTFLQNTFEISDNFKIDVCKRYVEIIKRLKKEANINDGYLEDKCVH